MVQSHSPSQLFHRARFQFLQTMIAALGLLLAFTTSASAQTPDPSFPCSGRLTQNERLICSSVELSQLDRQMVDAFSHLTSLLNRGAADLIRTDQRRWLKRRQACRRNYRCTRRKIINRYNQLQAELEQQIAFRNPNPGQNNGCQGGRWQGNQCVCPPGTLFDTGSCRTSDHGGVNCAGSGQAYHEGACVNRCPPGFTNNQGFCEPGNDEVNNPIPCGPGYTVVNGLCVHNSELESQIGPLPSGNYGIYVLSHEDSLRLDHTADKLLYTQLKRGNRNAPKQSFYLTFQNGAYTINDGRSGLLLHADGGGDRQVSVRYQPGDNFTRFRLIPALDGCYYVQTVASGNYWFWEYNSQVIQVKAQPAGRDSMFCFVAN